MRTKDRELLGEFVNFLEEGVKFICGTAPSSIHPGRTCLYREDRENINVLIWEFLEKRSARPESNPYVEKLDQNGDLISREDWLESVKAGVFIDYDGFGYPVRGNRQSRQVIVPSTADQLPDDATHVIWYDTR